MGAWTRLPYTTMLRSGQCSASLMRFAVTLTWTRPPEQAQPPSPLCTRTALIDPVTRSRTCYTFSFLLRVLVPVTRSRPMPMRRWAQGRHGDNSMGNRKNTCITIQRACAHTDTHKGGGGKQGGGAKTNSRHRPLSSRGRELLGLSLSNNQLLILPPLPKYFRGD